MLLIIYFKRFNLKIILKGIIDKENILKKLSLNK